MTHGKSIKLFLVDGSINGILTAEIINWTGHVLSAPRTKLLDLIQREECARTGIYFLSAMDQKIEVVAQQIEQAKQWKKGLLQQMFV